MEVTIEWLEGQRKALQSEVQQLERDIYAKDGAIQAIDNIIARMLTPQETQVEESKVNSDGSHESNNN